MKATRKRVESHHFRRLYSTSTTWLSASLHPATRLFFHCSHRSHHHQTGHVGAGYSSLLTVQSLLGHRLLSTPLQCYWQHQHDATAQGSLIPTAPLNRHSYAETMLVCRAHEETPCYSLWRIRTISTRIMAASGKEEEREIHALNDNVEISLSTLISLPRNLHIHEALTNSTNLDLVDSSCFWVDTRHR